MVALPQYKSSALFSEIERLVLEYADAMTQTPVEVPERAVCKAAGEVHGRATGGIDGDSGVGKLPRAF